MVNFLTILENQWLSSPRARRRLLVGRLIFWLLMFAALDHWTVRAFAAGS
jgi:hypothetical protein